MAAALERTDRTEAGAGKPGALTGYELSLVFAFWTAFAALTVVSLMLDPRGPMGGRGLLSGSVLVTFLQSYLWALLTPVVFRLAPLVAELNVRRTLGILIAAVLTATIVDVAVAYARFEIVGPPPFRAGGEASPFLGLRRVFFLDDLILFGAVLLAGVVRDYVLRLRQREREAMAFQAQTAHLEAQLAETRLAALRSQLDPHFLFNTLHAVATLVGRDPDGVRRMIARLSELLRRTLDEAKDPEIPLGREIDFTRRYLEIMQIRFQGALEVEVTVDPSLLSALVPDLLLQPLVENAIKHGVGDMEAGARVEILARREGDRLVLAVRDNGPFREQGVLREGVGLRITRERLQALYGDEQAVTVGQHPAGGFLAEVRLPYHTSTRKTQHIEVG